jgi:hypothetical protein
MLCRLGPLLVVLLGFATACGSSVVTGTGGGSSSSASSTGAGGASTASFDEFCDGYEAAAAAQSCTVKLDAAECKARAECDALLIHHPGDSFFDCLVAEPCGCLGPLYKGVTAPGYMPTAADATFRDKCTMSPSDCPLFEDLCLAGALFTDEALTKMTACFDLSTCGDMQACLDQTYMRCADLVY